MSLTLDLRIASLTLMELEMPDETITIPKAEYDRLVMNEEKLRALEAGGVDNWDWYGESLSEWYAKYYPED